MIRSVIQTEKYFYFSDPCSAELVVSGWLHDFSGMKNYPVILVIMIGHIDIFVEKPDDYPTIYVSMTLIDVFFFLLFLPCQDDHMLTKLCSRTSTTWAFEVPIPSFQGDIIYCCLYGWHSMTPLSEIQACFWRPDIAV